jgi:magnesium transporter
MTRWFTVSKDRLVEQVHGDGQPAPLRESVWIDLVNPTRDEEVALERGLGIEIPTREDMAEIETSSRLYEEEGTLYMTAALPSCTEEDEPVIEPVTFVLTQGKLVTVRYHDPRPFRTFPARAAKTELAGPDADTVFVALLEAVVDRLADILERCGSDLASVSRRVFRPQGAGDREPRDYRAILESIGRVGDLVSEMRDALVALDRLVAYFARAMERREGTSSLRARVATLALDIHSITDYSSFLGNKTTLLLDASLGMVGIEQNAIIKFFSVVAVVFLPPTLIASVYGMNFKHMPELDWPWGYPLALGLMLASAVLPYWLFKRFGWL